MDFLFRRWWVYWLVMGTLLIIMAILIVLIVQSFAAPQYAPNGPTPLCPFGPVGCHPTFQRLWEY